MDIDWRVIQLFLGHEGISETSVAVHDNKKVRCSCAVFTRSGRCKHAKYVRSKIVENNGNYTVVLPEDIPDEDAALTLEDPIAWREFVYKYGEIKVID
jgi:hypothetical protein